MVWRCKCGGRQSLSQPTSPRAFRRRGKADKARFMNLAEGSLEESRYYLILARDLGYGDTTKLLDHLEEVSRMLSAYAAAIPGLSLDRRHPISARSRLGRHLLDCWPRFRCGDCFTISRSPARPTMARSAADADANRSSVVASESTSGAHSQPVSPSRTGPPQSEGISVAMTGTAMAIASSNAMGSTARFLCGKYEGVARTDDAQRLVSR